MLGEDFEQEGEEDWRVESLCSLARAAKSQPRNSVDETQFVEVDEESYRHVQELHVAQQLGLVDWKNPLDCLCFDQDATFHQHVEFQGALPSQTPYTGFGRPLASRNSILGVEAL